MCKAVRSHLISLRSRAPLVRRTPQDCPLLHAQAGAGPALRNNNAARHARMLRTPPSIITTQLMCEGWEPHLYSPSSGLLSFGPAPGRDSTAVPLRLNVPLPVHPRRVVRVPLAAGRLRLPRLTRVHRPQPPQIVVREELDPVVVKDRLGQSRIMVEVVRRGDDPPTQQRLSGVCDAKDKSKHLKCISKTPVAPAHWQNQPLARYQPKLDSPCF